MMFRSKDSYMVILVTFYIIKTRIFYCCNRTRTPNHLVRKWTLNHLAKLTSSKWLCCVVSTYLYGCLTVCSCHVTYAFQSESTISSGLNGWVFVYELSGCGFESRCSHLNFKFRACFEHVDSFWNMYVKW